MKTKLKTIWKKLVPVFMNKKVKRFLACVSVILLVYFCFVNYTEPTEVGIARNKITGKMWLQEGGGIYITAPWVWVSCVDTRPMRVAITSAGRGCSAKLVQFNKDAWREFVSVEGWRYYWFANRLSFNFGYHEEYRGLRDIMRGYAYSTKEYSFLVILDEYQVSP